MQIVDQDPLVITQNMVKRGLRMQLHTSNYLTGQLVLGMDFVKDATPQEVHKLPDGSLWVPSQSGGLDNITSSVSSLLDRLNSIPFEQIGSDLQQTLHGTSQLANGSELRGSLLALQATLSGVQALVGKIDSGTAPLLKRLPEMAATLQATLDKTSKLVTSADAGYGGDSQVRRDLERLMAQLTDTARSVRLLADFLTQHPEALIQGRTGKATER
jgi:paraquat-inducible protein B